MSLKEKTINRLIKSYQTGAITRDINWHLSIRDVCKIVEKPCYLCKALPEPRQSYGEYPVNGIDRIDNNLGYFLGNIVACCPICNRIKSNEPLTKAASRIAKYRGRDDLDLKDLFVLAKPKNDEFHLVGIFYDLSDAITILNNSTFYKLDFINGIQLYRNTYRLSTTIPEEETGKLKMVLFETPINLGRNFKISF